MKKVWRCLGKLTVGFTIAGDLKNTKDATKTAREALEMAGEHLESDGYETVSFEVEDVCPEENTRKLGTTNRATAEKIVDAIMADLTNRRGLRQSWDSIEASIRHEIVETWAAKVEKILEKESS